MAQQEMPQSSQQQDQCRPGTLAPVLSRSQDRLQHRHTSPTMPWRWESQRQPWSTLQLRRQENLVSREPFFKLSSLTRQQKNGRTRQQGSRQRWGAFPRRSLIRQRVHGPPCHRRRAGGPSIRPRRQKRSLLGRLKASTAPPVCHTAPTSSTCSIPETLHDSNIRLMSRPTSSSQATARLAAGSSLTTVSPHAALLILDRHVRLCACPPTDCP